MLWEYGISHHAVWAQHIVQMERGIGHLRVGWQRGSAQTPRGDRQAVHKSQRSKIKRDRCFQIRRTGNHPSTTGRSFWQQATGPNQTHIPTLASPLVKNPSRRSLASRSRLKRRSFGTDDLASCRGMGPDEKLLRAQRYGWRLAGNLTLLHILRM